MANINLFQLADLTPEARAALLVRTEADLAAFMEPVQRIVEAVRAEGDAAVVRLAREIDRIELDPGRLMATEEEFALAERRGGGVGDQAGALWSTEADLAAFTEPVRRMSTRCERG